MSNIEKIRQEIEKWIYNTDEWEVSPGKYNKSESEVYKVGWRCGLGHIREFIDSLPEEKPSEDLLDAAKDALLLERAWLTLDGFGHEELAERLRQFAERKGLIWK